ncbi:hypothetical protein GCM10008025_00670 [Ornithinibacillus halotolerans]|uniref:Uncharacterized protein n=1 Tax=Ornithinibacillus halotolerans TaxID=1274357 RepID=A0A916W1W6_9BACI|nr:hypothetical protein GCM10008025_00670 [Ornithinibacillus halotolerans]
MNLKAGLKAIIRNPVILTFPISLQVILSFGMGILSFLGIGFFYYESIVIGDGEITEEFNIQFTLPLFIPLLSDLQQSLTFLPEQPGDSIVLTLVVALVYFSLVSYTMGMFLGSIKQVLSPSSLQQDSFLQLGYRYYWRLFTYQLFTSVIGVVSFYLLITTIIGGIIGFIVLLLYVLVPYIIVLEDKSFSEALGDSPKYVKRYFTKYFRLAIGAILSIAILSIGIQLLPNESLKYYIGLVTYTFIGSVFIAAFMHLLHNCIREEDLQTEEDQLVKRIVPKWKKWTIIMIVFLFPWLGVQFAKGEHVTAIQFQPKITYSEGVYYKANWSPANNGSNHTYTTYGFEDGEEFELTMSLPDSITSTDGPFFGEGEITWKVDKERITKNGNSTVYWGEEVAETSKFVYRLTPVYKNGTVYFTSNTENGFAELTTRGQSDEPMALEIFVMNNGNDIFVFQYKERFDPQTVIEVSEDGNYFIPRVSPVNPDDFKYFWYSKESITKDRIIELMKSKNETNFTIDGGPTYYDYPYIAVALLQQADGEALVQLGEIYEQQGVQTNISSKSAEEWTETLDALYGDVNLTEFLENFNKQNEYEGYEIVEGPDDREKNERQIIVPFPNGDISIYYVFTEQLTELEIVLRE